jgi:cytoskeleton protein RodZ
MNDFPQSMASVTTEGNISAVEPEMPLAENTAEPQTALPLVNNSTVTVNTNDVDQRRDLQATLEPAVPDLPIAPLASDHGRLVEASRAPTGEDLLVIKANDESWAEVVDANSYQLLYYPLRPGMVRSMQGQAPFRVFLGNAPAIELTMNQERFDHKRFHRGNNTARFSVDNRL